LQKISALPAQAASQTTPPATQVNPLQGNAIELKDIHLPEQISNYPIAYGWWLLAALLILATIFSLIKIKKTAQRNRVKKQALSELKNNPSITTTDTVALLKWAAIHYFSRAELAKLFGNSLQKFLISQLPINHQKNFTDLSAQAFLNQYQANDNAIVQPDENFYQAAVLWLTHALPPNNPKATNQNTNNNKERGVNA